MAFTLAKLPTVKVLPLPEPKSAVTTWSWSMNDSAPAPATTPPEPAMASLWMLSLPVAVICKAPPTKPLNWLACAVTVVLLVALEVATPMPTKPAPMPVEKALVSIESMALMFTSPVVDKSVWPAKITLAEPLFSEVASTPVAPTNMPPAPAVAWLRTAESPAPSTAEMLTDRPVSVRLPKLLTSTSELTSDFAIDTPIATPEATEIPKASVLA